MVKGNTPYEETPLRVTEKKGSMITASGNGQCITRNSSFFKRIPRTPENDNIEKDSEEFGSEPTSDTMEKNYCDVPINEDPDPDDSIPMEVPETPSRPVRA